MSSRAKVYLKLDGDPEQFDVEHFRAALGHDLNIATTQVEIPYVADDHLFVEVVLPEDAAQRLYAYVHADEPSAVGHQSNLRSAALLNGSGQNDMSDSQSPNIFADETPHTAVVEATLAPHVEPVAPHVEDLPPKEAQPIVDAENEGMPPPEVAIEAQVEAEAAVAEVEADAAPVASAEPVALADDPALTAGAMEIDPVIEAEAAASEAVATAEVAVDAAAADEPAEAERAEPLATPANMDELVVSMEVAGIVKQIALFGAFVDIGVGKDALLHISQLGNPDVRNVEDVLTVGQALNVFILKVDREQGRIALSMVKPIGMPWEQLRIGAQVTGTIIKVENYGVFLEFGAERPGMIHVSELADGYVKSPSDVVQMGQQVTAQIIKLDRKKKRIDLSVKALSQQEEKQAAKFAREEQQDEYVPTAMELALRDAMKSDDEFKRGGGKRERRDDRRDRRERDREDFFERTIRGHRN